MEAMDAHRYAQEAAYWLTIYRMATGRPAVSWDYDAAHEPLRSQISYTREAMRDATGEFHPFQQLPCNRVDTEAAS